MHKENKTNFVRKNNGTHKRRIKQSYISYPILKRSGTPLQLMESAREGEGALLVESSAPPSSRSLLDVSSETLQHFLYFFPLPQWHGWLGLGFFAGILCLSLCLDRALPLAETLQLARYHIIQLLLIVCGVHPVRSVDRMRGVNEDR